MIISENSPKQSAAPKPDVAQLGFGTVQWGQAYGIASQGRPDTHQVRRILDCGYEAGVRLLDVAHCYGEAESIVGNLGATTARFRVVTKTRPCGSTSIGAVEVSQVESAFAISLERLRRDRVEGLLVHAAEDLLAEGGDRLWGLLESLRDSGKVGRIGVSVYFPEQIERLMARFPLGIVQLPFSIYDQRFLHDGTLHGLTRAGVEVHARSAYLQGLLLMAPDALPARFASIRRHQERLHQNLRAGNQTVASACLRFACAQPDIDHVVVGFDNLTHCEAALEALSSPAPDCVDLLQFAIEDPDIIIPSRWT